MKRFIIILLLLSFANLLTGCNDTLKNLETKPASTITSQEDKMSQDTNEQDSADYSTRQGDWKLRVTKDEELYRMTTLIEYYGSTGIHIAEINQNEVRGSIHSVKGAPSYRQTEVSFSGIIEDGILRTTYEDTAWEYTGTMELRFEDEQIVARITRDESASVPMWGIPEGEFVFVRALETEKVELTNEEKMTLEAFLRPTTKAALMPFDEEALTDEIMINFVCKNLALGIIDSSKYGDREVLGADIVFEGSVLDEIIKMYFDTAAKNHRTYEIGTYQDGKYTVPALGGITEYPQLQRLLRDSKNPNIYYAIVDYRSESPEEGEKLQYQYLIKLHKGKDYSIKSVKEVEDPIDFALLDY